MLQALRERLPHERFIFLGDSARCPYGPREPKEVKAFVLRFAIILLAEDARRSSSPATRQRLLAFRLLSRLSLSPS